MSAALPGDSTPAPLSLAPTAPCPCGRTAPLRDRKGRIVQTPVAFADCCGPYLDGGALAPDAERLMRSRYSAFVLLRADYIRATWHPDTCPDPLDVLEGTRWLGLTVQQHTPTGPDSATVSFVARWRRVGQGGGHAGRMAEISQFVREDGRWLYVDGVLGGPRGEAVVAPDADAG
ncbi:YchJ family protein [Amphibiibacter pelophylacis]|uniref:YchJ family metal-binding protein n=1 Tax=Amphibiibacter pelophylacis TaxID=1799477 RepID=A0ACC6P3S4_9BURK